MRVPERPVRQPAFAVRQLAFAVRQSAFVSAAFLKSPHPAS